MAKSLVVRWLVHHIYKSALLEFISYRALLSEVAIKKSHSTIKILVPSRLLALSSSVT